MKRRKKRLTTRKRSALGWITALVLVVTAGHLWGLYCLTPGRALRKVEQESNCGRTEWIYEDTDPAGLDRGTLRLSGGDHAAVLGVYRFSWQEGWESRTVEVLEREPQRPFTARLFSGWSSSEGAESYVRFTRYFYIFGTLEFPETAELEVTFDAQEGGTDQTVRLTEADWITNQAGDRFFLCALEPEEDLHSYACCITAYDANGGELGTFQAAGIPHWE